MKSIKIIVVILLSQFFLLVSANATSVRDEGMINKIKYLSDTVVNVGKGAPYGVLENAMVDLGMAAVRKAGFTMNVDSKASRDLFTKHLKKHLKNSDLNDKSIKGSFKRIGISAIKNILIDAAINVTSDIVGDQLGSLAVREGVWLSLKLANAYHDANGNTLKFAINEAFILKEVAVKVYGASNTALKEGYALERSKVTSEVLSLVQSGSTKYLLGENSLIPTRNAIESAIDNSDLPDISKQELKDTYLSKTNANDSGSLVNVFTKVKSARDIRLNQLIKAGEGPGFEQYLQAYYSEGERKEKREQFDTFKKENLKSEKIAEAKELKEKHKKEKSEQVAKRESIQSKLDANKRGEENARKLIKSADSTLSFLHSERSSKQNELNNLLNKKGSISSTVKEEQQLSTLRNRIKWLKRVYDIKRKYSGKNTGNISFADKFILKQMANKLGYRAVNKMLAISGTLYTNALVEEKSLENRIDDLKNTTAISSSDQKKIKDLKNKLASLDGQINDESKRRNKLNNNLYNYSEISAGLIQDIILADTGIIKTDDTYYSSVKEVDFDGVEVQTPTVKTVWAGFNSIVGRGSGTYRHSSSATPAYNGETQTPLVSGGNSLSVNFSDIDKNITVSPNFGSYSYVAWGTWDGGTSTTFTSDSDGKTFNPVDGHWVYGQAIGVNDIPKTGSASYSGNVMGGYVNHSTGTVETNSITGTINMNVVFSNSNNSLSGTMNLKRSGAAWVNTSFSTGAARPSATGGSYSGELTVENGGSGNIRGAFFGPGAAEVAGSYDVDKQSGDYGGSSGVFRAKKQ